jgi:hypothetical protein
VEIGGKNVSEKYLPIGTVIFLKNLFQKVMVVGRVQYDAGNPGIIYDYSGVYYPQGLIDPKKNLLFQHTDIIEVVYPGYTDEEEKLLDKRMKEYLEKEKEK